MIVARLVSNDFDRVSRPVTLSSVAASALYLRMFDFRDTTTYLRGFLFSLVGVDGVDLNALSTSVTKTL